MSNLFDHLQAEEYSIVGPKEKEGAIHYDYLATFDEMPRSKMEVSKAGSYRLTDLGDNSLFRYTVGPGSLKKFLLPPKRKVQEISRDSNHPQVLKIVPVQKKSKKLAFWGIRSCDLAAVGVTDKVFFNNQHVNSDYHERRRDNVFVVAGCLEPGELCFCHDMKTGPLAEDGFDIMILETLEPKPAYLFYSGSDKGAALLTNIGQPLKDDPLKKLRKNAETSMVRRFSADNVKETLANNLDHPHWDTVADRCLSCANCTMVCPTCFCTTTVETSDLKGEHAERWLEWDSCFTGAFSYIHGGEVRSTTAGRYRQWLVHKLSTWHEQFGTSGCVGCGRCVSWCPAAIDLTEEVGAIRGEGGEE